jgi:hypothetical protein
MKQFWAKRSSMTLVVLLMLFFVSSCVDGYKDDWEWSSSVRNATLESPAVDGISVQFSADGTAQTISWPLVPGAGGYLVTVYNNDDSDNPIVIGEENEIVDGVTTKRPSTEDTKYKVVIKALGNEKNNNKEAQTASEKVYDNMLPVTATIPNNTNLTEYFNANPIPESTTELCYELEEGGSYTMTGNILQGKTAVTFRSSRINHANIAITDGSFVNGGAGLKFKFLDMDYSGFAGTSSNAVILMDSNFPTANLTEAGYYVVPTSAPIAIQSCKIMGLTYYLFYDNGQKYGIGTMLIKDCIIGSNTNTFANAQIRFQTGMLKDFTMVNSTFYNEQAPSHSSNRFMQISSGNVSSVKPLQETWANGSMFITNCTFYKAGKTAQSFNSNGAMGRVGDKVTIQKNIFVDCYENGRIISRFRRGNTTATYTGGENTQFYDGATFTGAQDLTADVNYFTSDPQLTYLGNGMFTMTGPEQVAARTGDPRWLPVE